MRRSVTLLRGVVAAIALALGTGALALPVELKDQNGSRYLINTAVDPLFALSDASGAVTNASYLLPVTVTSYFIGFTPWFGFTTVYTVQQEVNFPLTNGFNGFNGLLIQAVNGEAPPAPLVFNPGSALAADECPQGNKNRQLVFPTQTFGPQNLTVTRKVFVPNNNNFVRWLNVVTNTGSEPAQVAISLRGLLGSGSSTRLTATSSGDSSLGANDQWFTTAQIVPQGTPSRQPRIGFLFQGTSPQSQATSVGINSLGQAAVTFTPTIAPGQSAIVMTFATVQGNTKQAKSKMENLLGLPSIAIKCMSQQELAQVVNFPPITPPTIKKATISLNFKKADQDTINVNGKVTIGAGITLRDLPITVDVGGVTQNFILNKKGKADDGGGDKFSLEPTLKNGVTVAGTVKFSFQLKGDFKSTLEPYGLVDATVKNVPVSVPITFATPNAEYGLNQPLTYKAKQGKSGTAKSS